MSRFDYVQYDAKACQQQADLKAKFQEAEALIDGLDPGRAKSTAYTKLEEAYMWAGKAIRDEQIARNGTAPLQEERKDG